ncbi:hypothetical protein JMA_29560 [Jeotgalibacillus malaysiensis]|uniref:SH3b domain-containing protein n=1 Tax=Jeotgalibacillus malaysiensis TaxID=1508404 RepID=A0A0B5AUI8_9BACL|nr:cell wall-binding repeat-containing protein [Jeotgalibacillus malaysiensis]AJD92273.1 hypothetical protein JMA_29560 [Jeotgalibacillus malaysiensis]
MGLNRKILSLSSFFVLLLSAFVTYQASASSDTKYFSTGEKTALQTENGTIELENAEEAGKLVISTANDQVEHTYEYAMIEAVKVFVIDGEEYASIVVRHNGSANAIVVTTYLINESITEIHSTGEWTDASYDFTEAGFIVNQLLEEGALNDLTYTVTYEIKDQEVQRNEEKSAMNQDQSRSFSTQSTTPVKIVGDNPSVSELNRILTEEAIKQNIPPEIVKAIVYQEASMDHFWPNGQIPAGYQDIYARNCTPEKAAANPNILAWDGTNVKMGYDCIGIGIMQVSDWRGISNEQERMAYVDRLKKDIRFNIAEGLKILETKWGNQYRTLYLDGQPQIPKVNDQDRRMIDNWYFAILAYNGVLMRNDPNLYGDLAYQERIMNHIESFSQERISPFPKNQLSTSLISGSSFMRFNKYHFTTAAPLKESKSHLNAGDRAYINDSVNFRSIGDINQVIRTLAPNEKVTVTNKPLGYLSYSKGQHYYFLPVVTDSGQEGYVATQYLTPLSVSLEGTTRYETAASISAYGWQNTPTDTVVIGRGDLPIDSLTGSVLAAAKNAPLLLNRTDVLHQSVIDELNRVKPKNVYILGGESAISSAVASQIDAMRFNGTDVKVFRVAGDTRYSTAVDVANQYAGTTVGEVFLTTGDESSPDALPIAAYAGSKRMPILITSTSELRPEVVNFLKDKRVSKVTIIGGPTAISTAVENELKKYVSTVDRVSGADRYETSVAIAKKYYPQSVNRNDVFVARGDVIVDALAGSALAGRYGTPLVLTRSDSAPQTITNWLNTYNKSATKPVLHFLGSTDVINSSTRDTLEQSALR